MTLEFTKLHGCGNSFVVLDDLRGTVRAPGKLARQVCDYRKGIGADGLILAQRSTIADFRMGYWNADGTTAEMCGNGIRCLTKFLSDRGKLSGRTTVFETGAGLITTSIRGSRKGSSMQVLVDMGVPAFHSRDLKVKGPGPHTRIRVGSRRYTFVSMGNPHAVTFVSDHEFDIANEGRNVETASTMFPNRTNVEFVERRSRHELRVRVWERGCGITAACGTGACASVVAGVVTGEIPRGRTTVILDGGTLMIDWRERDSHVLMQGEAVVIAEGRLE